MIEWKHGLDGVEIEEPLSFADIVFNIQRDELWHGIFIEASTSQLGFYGEAFDILKAAKDAYGIDANVIYTASSRCEGETDYTEVISGKLNYGTYQESCGTECIIRMSIEQASCAMVFKNRFDQKVNIDSNIAFDKLTMLTDYTGLGFTMPLATQRIPISADADVSINGDVSEFTDMEFYFENKRTRYILDGVELDIDEWPLLEPYIEIEGESYDQVYAIATRLGFDSENAKEFTTTQIYALVGIDDKEYARMTFDGVVKK